MGRRPKRCQRCGRWEEKQRRQGKEFLCIECGIAKMEAQHRDYAEGRDPAMAKSIEAGLKAAEEMRSGEGPLHDKWKANLLRGLGVDPSNL